MKKRIVFIVAFLVYTNTVYSQKFYTYDDSKTKIIINDIQTIEKTYFDTLQEFINKKCINIKNSWLYLGDKSIFDSLFFIPVYNVQLKLNKEAENNYNYYLKLYDNKPINRILIFNKPHDFIGAMYLLKDINNTDWFFFVFNFPMSDYYTFSTLIDPTFEEYSKKTIKVVKKKINKFPKPVYIHINNFPYDQLFYLENNKNLMVYIDKKRVLESDYYFNKKLKEIDLINKSNDTIFKYIYKACKKDTTKLINFDY